MNDDLYPVKILFVCMGNICRSPTAEGCMRNHIQQQQDQDLFEIDSAGTIGYHVGEAPDPRSQQHALNNEVDISMQRSRKLTDNDFFQYDHLIAMDSDNLISMKNSQPKNSNAKISLMTDWLNQTDYIDVPDPYYGAGDGFKIVFDLLNEATLSLLKQLKDCG